MESRPIIKMKKSPFQTWTNIISLLIIGTTAIYLLLNYAQLPTKIPMHFNIYGEVDKWGPRWTIFILWGLSVLIYLVNTMTQSRPHKFNYMVKITGKNAEKQYQLAVEMMDIIKIEILMLLGYLQWAIISSVELNPYIMFTFLIVLFSTLGFYMMKSRKNC